MISFSIRSSCARAFVPLLVVELARSPGGLARGTSARRSGGTAGSCGAARSTSHGQHPRQGNQDRGQGHQQQDQALHIGSPPRKAGSFAGTAGRFLKYRSASVASGKSVALRAREIVGTIDQARQPVDLPRRLEQQKAQEPGATRRARPGWQWWPAARCPAGRQVALRIDRPALEAHQLEVRKPARQPLGVIERGQVHRVVHQRHLHRRRLWRGDDDGRIDPRRCWSSSAGRLPPSFTKVALLRPPQR